MESIKNNLIYVEFKQETYWINSDPAGIFSLPPSSVRKMKNSPSVC
jgi:hypothetical protein